MSFIDIQYVNRLQSRLPRYHVKSLNPLMVNFRCPLCGDSAKSTTVARGWVLTFPNSSDHYFYCHNCTQQAIPFAKFLQEMDQNLYKEYLVELFRSNHAPRKKVEEPPPAARIPAQVRPDVLLGLQKIMDLDEFHPARRYLESRRLPEERTSGLFYASKFKHYINGVLPDKFELKRDEGRIVLPLRDSDGTVFGVIGRAVDPKSLRYITILFDETKAKIFGQEHTDSARHVWILEGAFDSMFVPNSVAMAGVSIRNDGISHFKKRAFVLDNQPRNKDVVRVMEGLIEAGEEVTIWPSSIQAKDINQMVLDKEVKPEEIVQLLKKNTFSGLTAKLKLSKWKKT